jgi:CRP-like cAMP-binding protein
MLRWGRDKKTDKPKETGRFTPPAAPRPAPPPEAARRAPGAAPPAGGAPAAGVAGAQTLEEVLVEAGTITKGQLATALAKQKETGAFLGQILVDLGFIDENSLTSFLAKHCKIPHLSLLDYLIDEKQLSLIPKEVCLKYRLLPIDRLGKNLTVAMVNPLNQEALEEVRRLCPDLRIKPILCAWHHFEAVTRRLFGEQSGAAVTASDFGMGPDNRPGKAPQVRPAAAAAPSKPAAEAPVPAAPPTAEPAMAEPEVVVPESAPQKKPAAAQRAEPPSKPALVIEAAPEPAAPAQGAPPVEVEVAEEDLAAAPSTFDGDAVLGEVFKAEEEETAPKAASAAKAASGAGSIMQEMISVMRDSMRDTYAMLARRMELFRGVSPEVVARIFSKGMTLELEAGQTVFAKGDRSEELYVILGGKVDIIDGQRHIATLGRGDMFGEMALISNEPRSAGAVAVETTSVLALTFDVFEKILPKEAALQLLINIVITLSERLRSANNFINEHLKPASG